MKLAALILAAAVTSPPSSSPKEEDPTIILTPKQAAMCEAEGGCGVVTRQYVEELQRRAFAAGAAQGKNSCRAGKET